MIKVKEHNDAAKRESNRRRREEREQMRGGKIENFQ